MDMFMSLPKYNAWGIERQNRRAEERSGLQGHLTQLIYFHYHGW